MRQVTKLVGFALVLALLCLSVSQVIALFKVIIPPDRSLETWLGPTVTDGGSIIWGLTLVYDSPLLWQKAIAGLMLALSIVSTFICLIVEANLDLLRYGVHFDPGLVLTITVAVWVAVSIHILAWLGIHLLGMLHTEGVMNLESARRYERATVKVKEEPETDPLAGRSLVPSKKSSPKSVTV